MKTVFFSLVVVGLAAGGAAYYTKRLAADSVVSFRTAAIKRDNLTNTINSTGTMEPEEVIDVGAQVVGIIKSLGIDPSDSANKKTIDYGSVVHKDTVLALIDDAVYKAQVHQAQATLESSKANLLQLQAYADQTEQEWKRAVTLVPAKAIAETDYDLDVANYKAAKANVAVGVATIKQNEAALALAKTNLEYTVIKSPVEGVIVDREVNVGQTVVSSLSAEPVPHRQGSAADPGLGFGQRGGHRPHPRGHARKLCRRCLSQRDFPGQGDPNPLECHDDAERRHLYGGGRDRQRGRPTVALSDSEPPVRDRTAVERFVGAQRGVALEASPATNRSPVPEDGVGGTESWTGRQAAVVGASLGGGQAGQTEQRAGRAQPYLGAERGVGPAGRGGRRPERRIDDRD